MTGTTLMHASCVAVSGRAVLITGPSGSGKSSLALTLMALGADLVADDQTEIWLGNTHVSARCPPALQGLIEARGIGLLRATPVGHAQVALVADMGVEEPDRLPPRRTLALLGLQVDLVLGRNNDHLAASVLCYLKGSRQA